MEAEHLSALRDLAEEYSIRSPHKLLQLSRRIGAPWTLKECEQALRTSVPRQTLAPPPRSEGKSFAEAPGSRLQADLADLSLNSHGHENDENRYWLQVADVFTRKAYTEPMKGKNAFQVDSAMRKILKKVPNQGRNAVVTTDAGGEFTGLDKTLPGDATHRAKRGTNDISVVDRQMMEVKKAVESKAQTRGSGWAQNLKDATANYNETPHGAIHGAPDDVGEENAQTFMIYQDQAANFMHNRDLSLRRQGALQAAGGYREAIDNGGRSFKPSYGEVRALKKILPGAGSVQDARGNVSLIKEVRPVAKESGEPLAHITFQKRREREPREPQERAPQQAPERAQERAPERSVGGSSGSSGQPVSAAAAGGVLAAERFSQAQLRRADPISSQIMTYQPKTTDAQRAEAQQKKAAAEALRDRARRDRIDKSAAKEMAKQRAQLDRLMKKS